MLLIEELFTFIPFKCIFSFFYTFEIPKLLKDLKIAGGPRLSTGFAILNRFYGTTSLINTNSLFTVRENNNLNKKFARI